MASGSAAAEIPTGGDDERLLVEARKADPSRFADLYERNFDRVYAFVARRVGSRSEAEDLTAEVFHQALAHLRRFEWRGAPFRAWLPPSGAALRASPGSCRSRGTHWPIAGNAERASKASHRPSQPMMEDWSTSTTARCSPSPSAA